MPILKLTPELLASGLVCPPEKKRIELCDNVVTGLYIEVSQVSPGRGTFYVRYKDTAGKTCHQKLGRTTDLSLPEARKRAKTLRAEIQLGAHPRREERARKQALSLNDFIQDSYFPYVKPRKRSWKRDEQLWRLRIKPRFGERRLGELTRQEVQKFHTDVLAEGLSPASADHHVKFLRHALNLAVEWQLLEKNPITGVPLFNVDNKLENYLGPNELQRLLTVLRTDRCRAVCQIALFLLSTGCRLNEALRATWAQIDRANRVWRIPATNSKSKRVRSVPLNDTALEVLGELDTEGTFEHVFINKRRGKPYTNVMKVWTRLRKEAGLPRLRIHDLRHQYASFLVNSGRTLYEVQQILGHSDPSVTQRYAHLSTAALQEAANSASVAIRGQTPAPCEQAEASITLGVAHAT